MKKVVYFSYAPQTALTRKQTTARKPEPVSALALALARQGEEVTD